MNLKSIFVGGIGAASFGVVLMLGIGTPAVAADGAELFAEYKCTMCHNVAAAEITATVKSEKMKGPDLGGYKNEKGAELLPFLTQETELDGIKHKKKFPGGQEELDAVLAWLGALKAAE